METTTMDELNSWVEDCKQEAIIQMYSDLQILRRRYEGETNILRNTYPVSDCCRMQVLKQKRLLLETFRDTLINL